MDKIAFLGLGIMGRGMAMNISKAGYPLTVWNRTRSKAEEFTAVGADVAETPLEAAEDSDVVMMILADPTAVEETAFGPDGVIGALKEGSVLIDCSTVDPETSRKMAEAAEERGARFLDAPVAGSRRAAEDGELIMMVGGDEEVLGEVRPLLDGLSKKIIYAGGAGMGSYLKLSVNLMVSHMGAALAEALFFGAKAGLDPQTILDTIGSAVIASKFYDWKGSAILDRDFSTHFALKLMDKDLHLMLSAAYGLNIPLPVTASVKELYGAAKSCCDPDEDFCSVIRALETLGKFEVRKANG